MFGCHQRYLQISPLVKMNVGSHYKGTASWTQRRCFFCHSQILQYVDPRSIAQVEVTALVFVSDTWCDGALESSTEDGSTALYWTVGALNERFCCSEKSIITIIILHYITLYYIILHYIKLYYIILHYTTLYYIILHYITLYYITLYYIILHYITLYYIILHYITLYYMILHDITLYYIILHCITLYYIILHYITLYF